MTAQPSLGGRERLIRLSDADLSVRELGPPDAEPVVLLHGFLTSAHTWRKVVDSFGDRYRLILVDLPGSGGSPVPRLKNWTAGHAARLMVDLFDEMTLPHPAVVGTQMGGSIAAWTAALYPNRISRLVLMAAGALGERADNLGLYRALANPLIGPVLARLFPLTLFEKKWLQAHGPNFEPDRDLIRHYHRQLRHRGSAIARFGLGIRISYGETFDNLARPIAAVEVPTLLLFGADDPLVPPTTGHRFAELIPGSRLVLLPGCGDFPQEETPSAVATEITAFLAEMQHRDPSRHRPGSRAGHEGGARGS